MFSSLIPALITGGASILGNIFQNRGNSAIANRVNDFNAQQAGLSRDFQLEQSNTAYQRARKDMEAAGLNPILLASQGGASTPSSAVAQGTTGAPRISPFSGAASSAKEAMLVKANLDLLREQANNTRESSNTLREQGNSYRSQAALNSANTVNAVTQNSLLQNQIPSSALQAQIDTGKYGLALAYAKRLNVDFGTALDIVKSIIGFRSVKISDFINGDTGVVHSTKSYSRFPK